MTMQDTQDIDIHALLSERRQIAVIWSVEDVQAIRPDLNEDQSWEVLQTVESKADASLGVTWDTLEWVAQDLFGDARDSTTNRGRP